MIWTVQKLIDANMTVIAYCRAASCHHTQHLDLDALKEWLGPDGAAMANDLKPKLRCALCGEAAIGLIYSPIANQPREFEQMGEDNAVPVATADAQPLPDVDFRLRSKC
jgi:hypothetical protein